MTLAFVNVVGSLCCYNKGIQRTVGSNVLSDRSVCKGQRKNHRRTVQLLYLRAADHPGKDAENSYIHSEVYAAGELKHGTISLIEQGTLVIGVLTQSELYEKTISNMLEYKSRGAYLMGMTTYGKYETEDQVNFTVYVPKVDEHFVGSLAVISAAAVGLLCICCKRSGRRQAEKSGEERYCRVIELRKLGQSRDFDTRRRSP